VSLIHDSSGGVRLFRAPGWTDGAVVFESRPLLAPTLRTRERFTYRRESERSFRMTYEVSRDGSTWQMGDYLVCERGADAGPARGKL
jgi:hypothetical protein